MSRRLIAVDEEGDEERRGGNPRRADAFEIEKPSSGSVERATLSSSFLSSTKNEGGSQPGRDDSGGGGRRTHPDEHVIEALQHPLFCASFSNR